MTQTTRLTQLRVPALSVLVTVSLLAGLLLMQHLRHGWPFSLHMERPAIAAAARDPSGVARTGQERVAIDVDASSLERLGIRVETVSLSALSEPLRAVAVVVPHESRIAHAHTRVAGWVEELLVNTTGEPVRAGQPLARIFSQELLSSQTEYLVARRQAASGLSSAVVESGRTRLQVLGMADAEIDAIERSGEPMRLVTVVAPQGGVVVHRGISVGTAVDPSTELLTIADLSTVWVLAEVPEAAAPNVTVGTPALLDFPGSGREPFVARVEFLYPTLTERTRTVRARFAVANRDGTLRPGLYGTAELEAEARRVLTVPRDAVVDTGREQHVFVATGDGRFEPRPVVLGSRLADRIEVRSGLAGGEEVVASGVFLLDSESRLRASGGGTGHVHGASPAPDAAPPPPAEDPRAGGSPSSAEDPHAAHAPPRDAAPPPTVDPHAAHR